MSEGFNLPALPFEKLQKVVQAYGRNDKAKTKDDIASQTGFNAASITKSNAFLTDCGFITPGNSKSPTETGKQLAREIQFGNDAEIIRLWREAFQSNEALMDSLARLEVGGSMQTKDFVNHLIYCSQRSDTNDNRTGAISIKDGMTFAELLTDNEGELTLAENRLTATQTEQPNEIPSSTAPNPASQSQTADMLTTTFTGSQMPQVAINIQLQIPEMDDPKKYDELFASMKRNLFPEKN